MAGDNGLREKVHEVGGRMTRQRKAVLDALSSVDTHPTASEIYEMVRKELPDISQGTVYRNLSKLIELGYAKELEYGSGPSHFDATVEPHCHVRCLECGRVADLHIEDEPTPCVEEARQAAEGWEISERHVEFTGRCPVCRETD